MSPTLTPRRARPLLVVMACALLPACAGTSAARDGAGATRPAPAPSPGPPVFVGSSPPDPADPRPRGSQCRRGVVVARCLIEVTGETRECRVIRSTVAPEWAADTVRQLERRKYQPVAVPVPYTFRVAVSCPPQAPERVAEAGGWTG